jgi:two-component system alkaline phosphatase synthesis response regulator PhoP
MIMAAKKKRILIIEDEQVLAQLLKIELEKSYYRVTCAYDGEEGYAKYHEVRPDLIILDIKLPKMNGYEVCRRIRRNDEDRETRILMLTAYQEDSDRIIGRVVGAQCYMTKPFEAGELIHNIQRLLHIQ